MGTIKVNKYRAQKITINGETFDSRKEANRWCELRLFEKAGIITALRRQVKFVLVPDIYINGKLAERSVVYRADFTYYEGGNYIVEDAKGFRTKDYIIKRKLMLHIHKIRIRET